MAISTAPDLSGSGRVDMLTCPEALARAAVAKGASGLIETRRVSDTRKCGRLSFTFTHPPEDRKRKKKKSPSPPQEFELAQALQRARGDNSVMTLGLPRCGPRAASCD